MKNRLLISCILGSVVIGALACGSPPPPETPPPVYVATDNYSGHWEGAAHIASPIPGAPQQMDIVAVLVAGGGQCGTIEYSHAGCSGVWHCVGTDYTGSVLAINENIRFGGERCPDGASIELRSTNDPNILEFRYSHAAVQAAGQINRRALQ